MRVGCELDCEESWALKNWCFWAVVLEKTLENPLDCKKIQPVHSKGDQPWVFFGRNDAEATLGQSWTWLSDWTELTKDFGIELKATGKPLLPQVCETWGDPESLYIIMFSPLPLLLTRRVPRWKKIEGGSRKWVLSHLVDSLSMVARDVCFLYSHPCVISFTYTRAGPTDLLLKSRW